MRKRGSGKKEIKCRVCGKLFSAYKCFLPRRKYCSIKCRNVGNGREMEGRDLGGSIKKICPICKKEFRTFKSFDSECCSDKCRHILHREKIKGEKHPLWIGGGNAWRGCDWKYIKLLVLERDNYQCRVCGKTKRLHIHHKVPYRISKDNSLENLITLCMSCHMKEERKLCQN